MQHGLFLIVIGTAFPILMSTYSSVHNVDLIYVRAARNLGASTWMLFSQVVMKAALPGILGGLRVAIGLAWMVVVVAEMIAVPSGLGYRMVAAREYSWTDVIIAQMILIGLMGYLFDRIFAMINKHLLRWHRGLG
jgi:ABC-type nitrate/sulfonate/bicarbonate transport system, permease component